MNCPNCGAEILAGDDTCRNCEGDLTSFDVDIEPQSELERALLEDPISSVPPPKAVTFTKETSIYNAAREMNKNRIGCILVVENDQLIGIVSERDILFKAFQSTENDLSQMPLSAIMTPNPETLHGSDTLAYALNRMSMGGYRHLPIMEGERVVGLLSIQNILRYITSHMQEANSS